MKIVVIITTKDRYEFFSRAAASVAGQSRQADSVIVVSDSDERTFEREAEICDGYGFRLIRDEFSHNTAGSLNSGVRLYVRENLASFPDFDDTYVAVLDDDDAWDGAYLEECGDATDRGVDFVVSGIVYKTDDGEEELSVPHALTADDFLKGNPHIQGSNTFVRLDTLLRAGLYDENLPSCTDRDLFVRLMLDRPSYAITDEHMTFVDARSRPDRVTCSHGKKSEGLRKFYRKYGGMMAPDVERAFFERSLRLFGVGRDEITARAPSPAPVKPEEVPAAPSEERPEGGSRPLVVGFTATLQREGRRLLRQIAGLHRPDTKVVILVNFTGSTKRYEDILSASGYDFRLVRPSEVRGEIVERGLLTAEEAGEGDTVDDVCAARTMLQYCLHENSSDGDAVWVLDDDMELFETVREGGRFVTRPSRGIDGVLEEYGREYDAVIGTYTGDPPLPAFSTMRSSFVDLFYGMTRISKGKPGEEDYSGDYYYDLSEEGGRLRETPYPLPRRADVYEALSGKATARQLFTPGFGEASEVKNRGGNTVVFNRELLLIPVRSLRVAGRAGRRGDFVWTVLARRAGYRLAQVPFAVRHSKAYSFFDLGEESDKFLRDVVGAAFSHALDTAGADAAEEELYDAYSGFFRERMAAFTESFYRLSSLSLRFPEEGASDVFTDHSLGAILKEAEPLLERDRFGAALDGFRRTLSVYGSLSGTRRAREEAMRAIPHDGEWRFLGAGNEGVAYTDGAYVYKFFYDDEGLGFLREASESFPGCPQLYGTEFSESAGVAYLRYPYEPGREYDGGHAEELASLIRYGAEHGFALGNIKSGNFAVTGSGLKLIDYGRSIVPCDAAALERSEKRAFELLRYTFLSEEDFRLLIKRSYRGGTRAADFGWEALARLVEGRGKEQIHDGTVLALVRGHSPSRVLDYGAGKCRMANALAGECPVDAYDIDTGTLLSRAGEGVRAVTDRAELKDGAYDEVLCNLVLCAVDDGEAGEIVGDVARCLRPGGRAVFSVCDPFFDGVARTETRTGGRPGPYGRAAVYDRPMRGGSVRREHHRPADFYLNLLGRSGFAVERVLETDGVDTGTLLPAPEHLVLDCVLEAAPRRLSDLTLLIKVCPGDCEYAYDQIRHIVTTLERGAGFARRIVTADMAENPERPDRDFVRKREKLGRELDRARDAGLVDEVLRCSGGEGLSAVYERYFGMRSLDPHSDNGQGLYATLAGFEAADTRYVFHTDCDIMYLCRDPGAFAGCFDAFRDSGAVTGTMGVITEKARPAEYGMRTEVRTGFLDLEALRAKLPLRNAPADPSGFLTTLSLPWHRALDERLKKSESVRFHDPALGFVHPGEVAKAAPGFLPACRHALEEGRYDPAQPGQVDLVGNRTSWTPWTDAPLVVYVRGRNATCGKIRRMFDGLFSQTRQDFTLVYIDDASDDGSAEYARLVTDRDVRLKGRCVAVFNEERAGELANLVFAMRTIVRNPDAVVVNIDADDCLTDERALERIAAEFDAGADLTCGNCLRTDKPLRHYTVSSFRNLYKRDGDNVWLHPKCFRRSLFDVIDVEEDLKLEGEFYDTDTDLAFMLPMAERAEKPVFIDEQTYLYDPCRGKGNGRREDGHGENMRAEILRRAGWRVWWRWETEGEEEEED